MHYDINQIPRSMAVKSDVGIKRIQHLSEGFFIEGIKHPHSKKIRTKCNIYLTLCTLCITI